MDTSHLFSQPHHLLQLQNPLVATNKWFQWLYPASALVIVRDKLVNVVSAGCLIY